MIKVKRHSTGQRLLFFFPLSIKIQLSYRFALNRLYGPELQHNKNIESKWITIRLSPVMPLLYNNRFDLIEIKL